MPHQDVSQAEVQVSVIVVGAGYAGLSAAIELTRKGVKVKVFEAASKVTSQGSYALLNVEDV